MYCTNCGGQITSSANFCAACGHPVAPAAEVSESESTHVLLGADSSYQLWKTALLKVEDSYHILISRKYHADFIDRNAELFSAATGGDSRAASELWTRVLAAGFIDNLDDRVELEVLSSTYKCKVAEE